MKNLVLNRNAETLTLFIYNKSDISSALAETVFKHTVYKSTLYWFRFRKIT